MTSRRYEIKELFRLSNAGSVADWARGAIVLVLFASFIAVTGCALTSGANTGGSGGSNALAIATSSLPTGQLQSEYQASLSATGGKEPYTWAVLSGSLPPGLSLTSSSGTISGMPTQSGASTFTVGVEDASSPIATAKATMTISVASNTTRSLQIDTGSLPSGTVQVHYSTNLSASGGTAPYTWSIISGQLPQGLTLNSSGGIAGLPTTAGKSNFVAQVMDSSPQAATAEASFSITIANATSINLQINTTSLPAGIVQTNYSANLSASGGVTPYSWSIVSGQLPVGLRLNASGAITGIPTATGQASFVVQVTDSSPQAATAQASLAIQISNPNTLQISDSALPSGIVQISYTANLAASGGTPPYTWSIISGQLPGGLTLSSSGEIAGTPTAAGQFNFAVEVTDSTLPSSQTATQAFGISISPASSGVGPYQSRTDFGFIPLPVPLPSVGGAKGAGNCITEPGYNNQVCRVTDIDTLGEGNPVADEQEFSTCCGGWADINAWNVNSTMFFVSTGGNGLVAMSFDPATQTAAPLYGQSLPVGNGWWSYTNPQLAYALLPGKNPIITKMIFTSQAIEPQPVAIANLAQVPNCVPQLAGTTDWKELSVSHDEQTFVVGAGTGVQNSAIYVIVYSLTNGCRWYNTATGQIGGNWGPIGQATTSDRYTVHGVRIAGDGQTVLVGPANGTENRHYWNIASLSVVDGTGNANTGHFSVGYSGFQNTTGYTANKEWCDMGMSYRTFANPSDTTYIIPTLAQCGDTDVYGDDHSSWNNDDTSDEQPFFAGTVMVPYGAPITTAWQNEVLGFSMTNPGTVWRFFSTYSTGTSQFFSCEIGVGTVSQDGKWFMFTSDWGNTLGIDSSGNNRCDVFVGQLR